MTESTIGLRTGTHNGHLMVAALKRHADKPVMFLGETTLTGRETAQRISQYIQAFEALGAGTGTPGALLALNRPEVLFILGAGQTQGYRRTSLHPLGLARRPRLRAQRRRDHHADHRPGADVRRAGAGPAGEGARPHPGAHHRAGARRARARGHRPRRRPPPASTRSRSRRSLLPPDHIVSITYTGGTTGKPKGVIGTAGAMNTMTQLQLSEWEWPEEPRFLMCTPLSHAGAAFFVPTVIKGGSLYVLPRFDPAEVLRTIEEQKITATMLVPSMLYALMDHPDSRTRDLSSLETVYYGASAINPVRLAGGDRPVRADLRAVLRAVRGADGDQLPGRRVTTAGSGSPPAGARRRSCARRCSTRTASRCAPGEPGEICVAGPLLAAGYWKLPDETAETFRDDGWMHTGDVAREDEDGFWYIVDRTKDMIVTGGFNVFPREVEDVVAEHPAVAQVGVIGVPDERWGEAVTAIVVLRDGAELTDEVSSPRSSRWSRTARAGCSRPSR